MRESENARFHRYPELEAKRMLVELMEHPSQYNHILESFISRVTCRLAWGHSEANEELKQRARELLIGVSPTGAMGNKLPFLMSLPDWLSPPKAWERRRANTERKFFEIMQKDVERDLREKRAPQSWMKTFLEHRGSWGFQYDMEGAYSVGMHGIAGALTIAAPMQTFCLAMTHYPQYLPMLQEELDRVCGDRPPRSEDRENLPFLRAVIRECLRWRPPVPTGIPHYLIQDDSYAGYHIPKGSVMHPLEWAISRDPAMFPDPESFNPLRWVKPEFPTYREPLTQYPTVINCTQFGYGRRVCQGQGVADEDMLIGIGSIAWLFNIAKKGENDSDESCGDSGYDSLSETEELDEKDGLRRHHANATISAEELNAGLEKPETAEELFYPGAWPAADIAEEEVHLEKIRVKTKKSSQDLDPTLDFTTLLIAKPVPFAFELSIRTRDRAEKARSLFEEEQAKGAYSSSRAYWGEDQGKGKELGWGKV
ncbi:cytochrome P450 [Lophium mytilinum]|uniref:Cytochrome P450 n=1 Tax=Lophium mytilinum TaxID=390894 RepID=A0A6A6QJJ1_9PEZI|nr:cytochrome P450 [Lophium mytilinum]